MMKNARAIALAILLSAIGFPGLADRLVVVELFTSQGCSSCPPADALLGELTTDADVLPLALHVDYWDYIGWKDEFADPAHTRRQKGYAAAAGARTIYTPQMVVGGRDHVVGFKPIELAQLLMKHAGTAPAVDATATWSGDSVEIRIAADRDVGEARVVLVRFLPKRTVKIRRGENAGRTLSYHNIVAEMREVGHWNGEGALTTKVQASGEGEFAILVQAPNAGPILGAARVR